MFKYVKENIARLGIFILTLFNAAALWGATCLLLGPDPSFIIKLQHTPPILLAREHLVSQAFSAVPGITFSHAKRMAKGYYIVHVQSDKRHNSTTDPTCYSQQALTKIVKKIKQSPIVAAVTPNFLSSIMDISQDNIPEQWNLQAPPGGIDTEHTWIQYTKGSPNTTIAVLDTGIVNHDALNHNILPGVHFTNAGEVGVSATPSCMECAGSNHGTMVAGIIASTGESAYGRSLFGVAPHTTILPINVFTKFTDKKTCGFPPCIYSYLSDQINALQWLAGNDFPNLNEPPSTVIGINMSFGNITACPEAVQQVLNLVQKHHMSVIVAAGNQNNDAARDYPANCKNVISVAATGFYGERASYSNWGKSVTIAAPGGNGAYSIYSTINDAYQYRQGTSLAAPHVSGTIALLYAIDPTLDPIKVKDILTSKESITEFPTSEMLPVGSTSCIDTKFPEKSCGVGILNAYKAAKKV